MQGVHRWRTYLATISLDNICRQRLSSYPQMGKGKHPRSNRLARLRRAGGYDPAALASLCAVNEQTYLDWELGECSIPPVQVALLSDLYGVSRDYLLGIDRDGDNGEDGDTATKGAA